MSDLISAISVLLVFIIMYNERLVYKYKEIRENQPDTDQRLESKRYNRELVNTRNSFMFLFLFEIIIIIVIGWAVIDGYDAFTPLYVFIILICLSIIVLCINALFTIVEIWKKYKNRI